ncbi:SRPBCC family protein [Winogradskyella alexanderae]|uniref:GyrI-like domain-containing protein n=1 Tax=Winogradskyella alexanderae TaxID=2877123 RepID=A0ABS7XWD8_9FLAO|nr:GyrI-like domain-containing protein [Winogradskyella alexanderae]MCA0133718.1 GyrI-like domain-containing protein [Winogradskyella alexanderae]
MKALKYIILLLLIFIIGFSIYVAVQPNEFSFERSRTINAPAALLYQKVNDYKEWPSFSPWMEQDPDANIFYGESSIGENASYSWKGDILGEGQMTTLAVKADKSISQLIEFTAPFEAKSNINWTFEALEDGTKVTWAMNGKQDFVSKLFTTVMGSIESETGPNFERGLYKLDSLVTKDMARYNIKINGITEYGGGFYIYKTTNANATNISSKMGENFAAVMQFMGSNGIVPYGMPMTVYNIMEEDNVIMSNGLPVNERHTIPDDADVSLGYIPKTKVLKATLQGNYTNLSKAWETTMNHLTENALVQSDLKPFEVYINDPGDFPNPGDWITEIYIPLKD